MSNDYDGTGAMAAAWFGATGAGKAIDAVFGKTYVTDDGEEKRDRCRKDRADDDAHGECADEIERLRGLLRRIRAWDALDIPNTDGAFWQREIDAALTPNADISGPRSGSVA